MSSLAEIEAAVDSLPREHKEELLRYLAMHLRQDRPLPEPRIYSQDEISSMLAEDKAEGEEFRRGL